MMSHYYTDYSLVYRMFNGFVMQRLIQYLPVVSLFTFGFCLLISNITIVVLFFGGAMAGAVHNSTTPLNFNILENFLFGGV